MPQFDYLISFAAIILALAIADLCISLNRLLQAQSKVKWDWLAPMAAATVFIEIIVQWWNWFGGADIANKLTFGMFLSILVGVVLLFLMASTTLPDAIEEGGIDLRTYYQSVARRFWLFYVAHFIVATAAILWIEVEVDNLRLTFGSLSIPVYVIVPVSCILAFNNNRTLHTVTLGALFAFYISEMYGHTLT